MRVVFLDYDGVLIKFSALGKKMRPAICSGEAITMLNVLVLCTDAKVVVTSSWRLQNSTEKLADCMKKWGFLGTVVGKTLGGEDRGQEILTWVAGVDVESFVVLDDEPVEAVAKYLVRTDPMLGLQWPDAIRAAAILGGIAA